MSKASKKRFIPVIVCVLSAVLCFGMLTACGDKGGNTTPEQPVHHAAVAAKCDTLGNIEYWSKGGKCYSDEACTKEISKSSTVIAILGHDFKDAPFVTTDADRHWKVCKRDGCDATAEKADHKYEGGKCVCGKDEPKAPETPKNFAAKAAKCTEAGNIEYWTKGGKFYSDEACTKEIAEADTVIAALDHDFEDAPYEKNDAQHWQVCKREGCDVTTTKVGHEYNGGNCVCGKEEPTTPVTSYTVTVDTAEHGTVEVSKTSVIKDEEVTVTVTPAEGYFLDTLVYNDGDNDHDITADKKFTMPEANVTVKATFKAVASTFEFWQFTENDTDLGATRVDNGSFVKISATAPDDEAWHIKVTKMIEGLTLGHYYEITYTVKSNVSGTIWFESFDGAYLNRGFAIENGENTVKYGFWVGKVDDGKTAAVLQLGALPAFEVEIAYVSCVEKQNVGNFIDGWWLDTNSAATAEKKETTDGTIKVEATGSGDGWHLKLAKDVTLEKDHVYELTMVFVVSGRKDGNIKYVIYDDKATVNDELCWTDHDGLYMKTFKFTANESCTIGSCLEYGDITNAEHPITLTVAYIELWDVTPPPATPAE